MMYLHTYSPSISITRVSWWVNNMQLHWSCKQRSWDSCEPIFREILSTASTLSEKRNSCYLMTSYFWNGKVALRREKLLIACHPSPKFSPGSHARQTKNILAFLHPKHEKEMISFRVGAAISGESPLFGKFKGFGPWGRGNLQRGVGGNFDYYTSLR